MAAPAMVSPGSIFPPGRVQRPLGLRTRRMCRSCSQMTVARTFMDYLTAGCHKTVIKMQYSDRNPQTCLLQGLESTGRLKVQWNAGILTRRLVGTSVKVGCKVAKWTLDYHCRNGGD
ncbi:hypothetical protein EMIT0194MI4_10418 [Pseudomonas sp. IT-194MI4]